MILMYCLSMKMEITKLPVVITELLILTVLLIWQEFRHRIATLELMSMSAQLLTLRVKMWIAKATL